MVVAFVFAIGSAFVTKASNKPYNVGFIQVSGACNSTTTICNLTDPNLCSITVYRDKNGAICSTQLTQQP